LSTQGWIWIAIGLSIAGFAAFFWTVMNARGVGSRGASRGGRDSGGGSGGGEGQARQTDRRKLARHERRLFDEAQRLINQGKFAMGAQMLEQIGMAREAIETLENAGLIHEAAKILMRMQRHNRAGVVYARHGMWDRAAQCFKMANMPLEVAKCLREAGDLAQAAEFFERAGRMEEAADAYGTSGNFRRAGRILAGAGLRDKAFEMYRRMAESVPDPAKLEIDGDDLRVIVEYLASGFHTDSKLADIAIQHGALTEVMVGLFARKMTTPATELFLRAGLQSAESLMAQMNYSDGSAEGLAQVFMNADAYLQAGMVYERLQAFAEAAIAFERAEEHERSAYCYERAKDDANAKRVRDLARGKSRKPSRIPTPFSLADVSGTISEDAVVPPPPAPQFAVNSVVPLVLRQNSVNQTPQMASSNSPRAAGLTDPSDGPSSELEYSDSSDEYAGQDESTDGDDSDSQSEQSAGSSFGDESDAPTAIVPVPLQIEVPQPPPLKLGQFSLSADAGDEESKLVQTPSSPAAGTAFSPFDSEPIGADSLLNSDGETGAGSTPPTATGSFPESSSSNTEFGSGDSDEATVVVPAPQASAGDAMRQVFHRASFLADLEGSQKDQLWSIGRTVSFAHDETILTFNDEPDGLYVVLSGVVSCYRLQAGREVYVDQMGEAESFGELWLLAGQPSAVKFVASRGTVVHVVDRDPFTALLDRDGTIARKVYKRFTMRLLKRLLRTQNHYQNKSAS